MDDARRHSQRRQLAGQDLLAGAPSPVRQKQHDELHIQIVAPQEKPKG